ncbi:hypothetical protein M9H77_11531 [Catharanthus roseus]|uniref:Uncharacterized protein n=1 Tax=Catharanthus roseus TaxID=4058 RepID=A0ACC0BEU9_CATRO|nr:hypothetical protein M9H77_11531 [Catharanthus roseus]
MGFRKGRKASLAFVGKNTCKDSCSCSRKVLGKFHFRLLVLAQGSIGLVSEVRLSWAQTTIQKQRKMPISEFSHFVASINAIQSPHLSAVKMAVSGERAYSSSSSQGY